jgi:hypothetical protein
MEFFNVADPAFIAGFILASLGAGGVVAYLRFTMRPSVSSAASEDDEEAAPHRAGRSK